MGIIDLWLPIVVSAAACWVMSAIIWTALKYHNSDYKKAADEDSVRAALKGNAPGYYLLPYCLDPGDLKNPDDPIHRFIRENKIQVLKPNMATGSKVYYNGLDGGVR